MSKRDVVAKFLEAKSQARASGLPSSQHPSSPRVLLDESLCEWLPLMDYEYVVRDEEVLRLHIRVRPTGGKHFELTKKVNGKQMRQKVCSFGDHLKLKAHKVPPGEPPPETVRSRANRLMIDLEAGLSPSQKRAERAAEAALAANQKEQEARDSLTLFAAAEDYIETAELADSTRSNYTTYLNKHLKDWSPLPLASFGTDEVMQIQATIRDERGPVAANNALRLFRAVWNVAAEDNPAMGACPTYILSKKSKKKVSWAAENRRDRYVHEAELSAWWEAVEKLRLRKNFPGDGNLMADYLQFALLTGMRRTEITKLRWTNISFSRNELHLTPAQNLKGKRKWTLPLTGPLIEILKRREQAGATAPFEVTEPRRAINRVRQWSGVDFSMHDLRRSFASHAEATRMPLKTLKLLMNHATEGDVTMGYISNKDVLAKELTILHDHILGHAGVKSNVKPFSVAHV